METASRALLPLFQPVQLALPVALQPQGVVLALLLAPFQPGSTPFLLLPLRLAFCS